MPVVCVILFLYQVTTGEVPPLTPEAVNVTEVPAQTEVWLAAIETLGLETAFTVKFNVDEVAGLPIKHVGKEPPAVNVAYTD